MAYNLIQVSEPDPVRRRSFFDIRSVTDGITPVPGLGGGQPEVSLNGGPWGPAGVGVLNEVGNGRYFAELGLPLLGAVGTVIQTRYQSPATAESPGDAWFVVNFDPANYPMALDPVGGWGGLVVSGVTTYCTPAEMVERVDWRILAQWVVDTEVSLTLDELLLDPILGKLLKGASGELESACLVGERYSPADLHLLLNGGTNAGEYIKDIVAWLCFERAWARRPRTTGMEQLPAMCQWAMMQVEDLRTGKRIFGLSETAEAGRISYARTDYRRVEQRKLTSEVLRRQIGRRVNNEPGGR